MLDVVLPAARHSAQLRFTEPEQVGPLLPALHELQALAAPVWALQVMPEAQVESEQLSSHSSPHLPLGQVAHPSAAPETLSQLATLAHATLALHVFSH